MPLKMDNSDGQILSTKVLADAVIGRASALGIDLICLPFIETVAIDTPLLVSRIASLADRKLTAIFTSAAAVSAVGALLPAPPQWTIYCLFGATRSRAQQYFPTAVIHADAENGAVLADRITAAGLKEVHFFCGDRRMDTIPERLKEAGIKEHQYIVYRTEARPHPVALTFAGILFFSPSAVGSFFSVNRIPATTVCYAVGPTTANALRAHTTNIIIAAAASQDAVLDEVIKTIKTK